MSRETDRAEALRVEIVRALVVETGMGELMAVPIADSIMTYMQREHGGECLYVPKNLRAHPIASIEADLRRGVEPSQVCATYRISRRTLGRLFPGGLPEPASASLRA